MTAVYTLTGVEQRYGARTVLRLDRLSIEAEAVLGVVGPSGAGKSTLLRLLALLEAPTGGRVVLRLDGRDITQASVTLADRRQMAMVFQRPVLLSRSVRANVAYGLRLRGERDARALVDDTLRQLDLLDLADAPAHTLSGGEAQRAALARALVLAPRILLLDEPTVNLDPQNVQLIESLIRAHQERFGTTIVLVTHNIHQARRLATHAALLLAGELVEAAPADRFFDAPRDPRTAAFLSGDLIY